MNLRIAVAATIVTALCVVAGCADAGKKYDKEELTRIKAEMALHMRNLEEKATVGRKEAASGIRKVLKLLDEHGASYVTTVPDPYLAGVGKVSGGPRVSLVIYWLERDSDLAAVRVREYWHTGEVLSEIYELDCQTRKLLSDSHAGAWRSSIAFVVTERQAPQIRKDEQMWSSWAAAPAPDSQPPLYIAGPSEKVHVLISLIDSKGHESRALALIWAEE